LVGDGILRKNIEDKVARYQLEDKVIFLGERNDVNEVLQCFDLFVFPSKFEGLPLTLIEAQAAGIKCLVSDTVSVEVKISELVEFKSLSDSPKKWAELVVSNYYNSLEREDTSFKITEAGY